MENENHIKFLFAGDTMFGLRIADRMISGSSFPAENIKMDIPQSDFFCCNLETVVTDRKLRSIKFKHDKIASPSLCLDGLKDLGINLVSIANNHIFDFATEGLTETMNHLNEKNISYIGAGQTFHDANLPKVFQCKDTKIGFLARTFTCEAANSRFKSNEPQAAELKRKELVQQLADFKKECNLLVIILHIGFEYCEYPNYEDVKLCHQLIDQGANLIICHHPHVIQGIETYGNGLIAYSLGNFIFDNHQETDARTGKSFILEVNVANENETNHIANYRIHPTFIDNESMVHIINGKEKIDFLAGLKILSEKIISDDFEKFSKSVNSKVIFQVRKKEIVHYLKQGNVLYLFRKLRNIRFIHLSLLISLITKIPFRKSS